MFGTRLTSNGANAKAGAILLPTDFSEMSEVAAGVAREIALQTGACLHLVHVVPPVTDPADSADRLAEMARRLGDGLRIETALLSGRVARQIVGYAREHGIGVIVLATHGRTGLTRAILGSVAEAVVRLAPCLVLAVPAAALGAGPPVAAEKAVPAADRCIVCLGEADDLVCETCRVRIRAEAAERKIHAERPGRRGSPV
jgi:nucleotide-binding universal stress UspA family protein